MESQVPCGLLLAALTAVLNADIVSSFDSPFKCGVEIPATPRLVSTTAHTEEINRRLPVIEHSFREHQDGASP
jgi:hypothetical protein